MCSTYIIHKHGARGGGEEAWKEEGENQRPPEKATGTGNDDNVRTITVRVFDLTLARLSSTLGMLTCKKIDSSNRR